MKMINKLVNFFTYEDDGSEDEKEKKDSEKINLKKELMEERKKYAKQEKFDDTVISTEEAIEPVKKQVMFVDETFERKEKVVEEQNPIQAPKYTELNEKKFKPTSYISPVHGLIKEAEPVEVYETETKTISESDYSKIRDKAFGNAVFLQEEDEEEKENEAKFFATSEIIDLQKRMQIDNDHVLDKDLTVDEAYKRAEGEGIEVNSKAFTEVEEDPQYLFDLLDELKEDSKDE